MTLIYSDTEPRSTGGFSVSEFDPVDQYIRHMENWLYLTFIVQNSNDLPEKFQATKELKIADRKLNFWERNIPQERRSEMYNRTLESKKRWKIK